MTEENAVDRLREIVGESHVFTDPAATAAYLTDWMGDYSGDALAVVRPGNTREVSAVVEYCGASGIAIVPQGGRTGLSGGGVPVGASPSVVVSLARMDAIRKFDDAGRTIIAEAGVILEVLQDQAAQRNLLFPLSFGAKGSCTIGGNLATNAGGSNVLRYGNTRDLCLGIEAVMADGSIINGLSGLRKDNTGYDLKDLLIGSEGTLGIITAAVLKLFPRPSTRETAFLSMASLDGALQALNVIQDRTGNSVEAFEYITQPLVDVICNTLPGIRAPLAGNVSTAVLLELGSSRSSDAEINGTGANRLRTALLDTLEALIEAGIVEDAVIAQSERERAEFWHLRESVLEALMANGPFYFFDISLPLANVAAFVGEMDSIAAKLGFQPLIVGHLGDGNLHYALTSNDGERWQGLPLELAKQEALALLQRLDGSFSAEHGIGQEKLELMRRHKDPAQLSAMAAIKQALDPAGILNPGKVVPIDPR
ncbi:MAG: FAD-binding oxidoreductase [Gammaproteobacteria bacterium]|nr:FAD-binding oxidoreductase [Gammaproteobacteria bacterium]